jgi:hypothetical protein
MAPWATAAIDDDELAPRQRLYSLAQLLEATLTGGRADVLRAWNVCLGIKYMGSHLNQERFLALGRLKGFRQLLTVD